MRSGEPLQPSVHENVASLLTERIGAFLDAAAAQLFQYGTHDCALMLADWGRELTGIDGAADLRGTYRSEAGCARVLRRAGGLVAVVDRCATRIGFARRDVARAGDIGVGPCILRNGETGEAGGLCVDARQWASLAPKGIFVGTPGAPILHIWGPK